MPISSRSAEVSDAICEYGIGQPSQFLESEGVTYGHYSERVKRPIRRIEVPKSRVVLILELANGLGLNPAGKAADGLKHHAFVSGLSQRPILTEHCGESKGIEIELTVLTAYELFGPVTDSACSLISLEDVWGKHINQLIEQIIQMTTWEERFSLIDNVLSERLSASTHSGRPEGSWAWHQLERTHGNCSIRKLAQEMGWSDRHFAACFKAHIGMTPKAAARQIRFSHAVQLLRSAKDHPLSEIAIHCGYSDQSHFTREFRRFACCSPRTYRMAHFTDLPGTPSSVLTAAF